MLRKTRHLFFCVISIIACLTQQTDALTIAGGELTGQVGYRSMYDSNLLKYSAIDRSHFRNNIELFRSDLRTLDDLRSDLKLSTSFSIKAWGKRETQFSTVFDFAHHLMNPIKNFGWMSLTVSQELSDFWSTSLNYFFDMDYYLREYNDVHTGTRQGCDFSMDQWTGRINFKPLKKFEFVGFLQYKKYAYNEYFTEYDSDYYEFGGEIIYRAAPWRFAAGYHLGMNENIGFNKYYQTASITDVIEDSEEGQGDYQQDIYFLTLRYPFRLLGKRSRLLLETSLEDRYYTTDLDVVADPFHSGRNDRNLALELSLRTDVSKIISFEFGAGYYNRRSKAPTPVVSRVKDFDRMTCWLELSHDLGL